MKLRAKILTLFFPTGVLPLILFVLFCFSYLAGNSHKQYLSQLDDLINQTSQQIRAQLRYNETLTHVIATESLDPSDLSLPSEPDSVPDTLSPVPAKVSQSLNNYPGLNPEIGALALLLPNGQQPPVFKVGNLDSSVQETIRIAEKDDLLLSSSLSARDKRLMQIVVRKVQIPQNNWGKKLQADFSSLSNLMYLAVQYDLTSLKDLASRFSHSERETLLLLVDQQGVPMFASLYEASTDYESVARQALTGRIQAPRSYQTGGREYLAGFERIHPNLYLVGLTPQTAISATAQNFLRYAFWLFLVMGIFSFWAIRSFTRQVLINPLQNLHQLAGKIKAGEEVTELPVMGTDEIAGLTQTINEMAQGLQSSRTEINKLVFFDLLTQLPNRVTFDKALARAITSSETTGRAIAVLFIDLDNFKLVNDVYGHSNGDRILKEVAHRLRHCLSHIEVEDTDQLELIAHYNQDMIARNGGDEFAILLTDLFQAYQASLVAQSVIDEMNKPFEMQDTNINLGCSVGIALFPLDGHTSEQLTKNADLAMFEAKKNGKNGFQFFTPALNATATRRLETEQALRLAVKQNQFIVHYQPIYHLNSGRVSHLEALVRWNHPQKGLILPAQFIQVAEESELIIEIGRWVIEECCAQLSRWSEEGRENLKVSINLSSSQLTRGTPVETIKNSLEKHGLPPTVLEIEIKESLLTSDQALSIEVLNSLKAIGLSISLDDFGRGYASMLFLRKFPIDTIKLDRNLLREMEKDSKTSMIVESAVKLAHGMDLSVVAEGVETLEQLNLVKAADCDYAQGYYYAKPSAPEELSFEAKHGTLQANSP